MPSEKKCVKCGQLLSGINPGKPVAGGWPYEMSEGPDDQVIRQ